MKEIFNPQSIAIIGASNKEGKIGRILVENIKTASEVKIFPVNPKEENILDIKAFPSVLDIKDKVDLAVIAVPAELVPKVIEECAWKADPIKNIVIISAGFSEIGKEGKKREEKIKKLAQKYELNIIGPNCLGIINSEKNFNASFAKSNYKKGKVGLIAQSGALITALFDLAKGENFGFSLVATLGNKAGLDEVDFLKIMTQHAGTEAIALYLEEIKRGKEFLEQIKKYSFQKTIIVLKAGNSSKAQKAILSHTGSMAGETRIIQEAVQEAGGIFCSNLFELLGALKVSLSYKKIKGKRTLIVTNAGGPGVIATDVFSQEGFEIFDPSKEFKDKIAKILPLASALENPIDVLGDAQADRYEIVFKAAKGEKIDLAIAIITPQAQTKVAEIVDQIEKANQTLSFPIFPCVIGFDAFREAQHILEEKKSNLSVFRFPLEVAVGAKRVLDSKICHENLSKKLKEKKEKKFQQKKQTETIQQIFESALADSRKVLFYQEAFRLGREYQLNILEATYLNSKDEVANFQSGSLLVMKVDSPKVIHKNSKGGVVIGIRSGENLKKEFFRMKQRFPKEKILLQKQQEIGMEVIIGARKDPSFGKIILVGLGGIFTEFFQKNIIFILPKSKIEMKSKIEKSELGAILKKSRVNITEVVQEAQKIAKLFSENELIDQIDANPIFFYPKDSNKKAVIVDFKIILE